MEWPACHPSGTLRKNIRSASWYGYGTTTTRARSTVPYLTLFRFFSSALLIVIPPGVRHRNALTFGYTKGDSE